MQRSCGISVDIGRVQNQRARNGFDFMATGERPNDSFVRRDFDQVRRAAKLVGMSEPVGHERVAVGQSLEAGHELEADAGQFIALHLPDRFASGIHFKNP